MQRNESLGDREYFTTEENEENRERSVTTLEARAESHFDGVGGYNSFWYERATIGYDLRTSLITYPENGRIPPAVEGAFMQRGGVSEDFPSERPVRFVVGGIAKDGPEDRGLSERCIVGFNAGPPFMPSSYNNNVQLIQHQDHVVILTEMIHDARVVPLDRNHNLTDDIRLWAGDSRGYWDGDTLVVETKNFNGLTQSFISSPYGEIYDWLKLLDSGNKQGIINVEEVLKIQQKMSLKSHSGGNKVLIIWGAEKLNSQASNKLLKIIEEPPKNSYFILITEKSSSLLPTLISRCQRIKLAPIESQEITDALKQYDITTDKSKLVKFSKGSWRKILNNIFCNFFKFNKKFLILIFHFLFYLYF